MDARCASYLLTVLLLSGSPAGALAQDGAAPLVGQIVRVTPAEGGQVIGTVTALDGASLEMAVTRGPRSRTFPLSQIRTLERRVAGESNVGEGALWGAGLGLVAGGVAGGMVMSAICSSQDCGEVPAGVAVGGAMGAAGGGLVGVFFGALSSSTVWELVPLERLTGAAELTLARGDEGRLALVLRLRVPRPA